MSVPRMSSASIALAGLSDPLVFSIIGPALLFVVAAASYLPARVASRTDPITVLQPE